MIFLLLPLLSFVQSYRVLYCAPFLSGVCVVLVAAVDFLHTERWGTRQAAAIRKKRRHWRAPSTRRPTLTCSSRTTATRSTPALSMASNGVRRASAPISAERCAERRHWRAARVQWLAERLAAPQELAGTFDVVICHSEPGAWCGGVCCAAAAALWRCGAD